MTQYANHLTRSTKSATVSVIPIVCLLFSSSQLICEARIGPIAPLPTRRSAISTSLAASSCRSRAMVARWSSTRAPVSWRQTTSRAARAALGSGPTQRGLLLRSSVLGEFAILYLNDLTLQLDRFFQRRHRGLHRLDHRIWRHGRHRALILLNFEFKRLRVGEYMYFASVSYELHRSSASTQACGWQTAS